ncbi:MAG: GNAT family protein [Lachnospiraceae bacterium]|nr:GNAT family protein [Lachnospiraceae bacterium]
MKLKLLKREDAIPMLEWMHDTSVVSVLPTHFEEMTIEDCYAFIEAAKSNQDKNLHLAICNDEDEYLGTVSLKNINPKDSNAEFAITISKKAMGQGVSGFATREILRIAFEQLNLKRVYLCVFSDNLRAKKFYKKIGFLYEGTFRKHMLSKDGKLHDLEWYAVLKEEIEKYSR